MRIGLTGIRGVLGNHIARYLELKGSSVFGYTGDVRDEVTLTKWASSLDLLIHAAAMVPVAQVASQLCDAINVNVGGTANAARAAKAANCRLVYISSSHVYQPSDHPLFETDPVKPASLYGLTKLQGEEWARLLADEPLILRVFSFFDERQPDFYLVSALYRRILAAPRFAELELEGASSVRDIASAAWLGNIIGQLATEPGGGIINCGTGQGHTILSIALTIASAMGREDIRWIAQNANAPNTLVARTERLKSKVSNIADFDLSAALTSFVHAKATVAENS